MDTYRSLRFLPVLLALAIPTTQASGAATYSQNFDDLAGGTPSLAAQGWMFRDQSSHVGAPWWTSTWVVTTGFPPSSQAGVGHLAFETSQNLQTTTQISSWTILPAIPGQAVGDVLEFHCAGAYYSQGAVEVRYSSGGGTSTGSGATALGDFTTLLTSFAPTDAAPWHKHSVNLPGNGRIAFRVFGSNYPMFANSPHFQLDSLAFNPAPPPFPIPIPGQTVHWTAAMSPIEITSNVTIPATGKVIVDPGVEIRIADGKRIDVSGTLDANGAANAQVRIVNQSTNGWLVPYAGGTIDLEHAEIGVATQPQNGARIFATDCTFFATASIKNAALALLEPARSVLRFERCTFAGSTVQVDNVMARLREVAFTQQTDSTDVMLFGYVRLEDISIDGTSLRLGKKYGIQPVFVDTVSVRNSTSRGGLYLQGGTDFLLGPGNVLTNDRWPVEFGVGCAGLLPGSVVPSAGNVNDYVADTTDPNPQFAVTWAKIATPYVVSGARYLGHQTILPGAHVKFMADASWRAQEWGTLEARGTRAAPIVFERSASGASWAGLQMFNGILAQRLEHCVFRGGELAVSAKNVWLDSCVFEDNGVAVNVGEGTWVAMRGCRFTNNLVGVNGESVVSITDGAIRLGATTNPNSFTGNGVAVRASNGILPNTGSGNWWGDPSGPSHPTQNPAGQGDPIQTFAPFPFSPFLPQAPSYSDAPPEVEFIDGRKLTVEPGMTLLISWRAEDDGAIVSQRAYFSSNGASPILMPQLPTALSLEQRTLAFTVPSVGYQVNGVSAFLRVEVEDESGLIGTDELELYITDESLAGTVSLSTPIAGATYRPGDQFGVNYTTSGVSPIIAPSVNGYLVFDNDREFLPLGGATYTLGSLPLGVTMPDVSTDRARLALVLTHSLNTVTWFFSEPFAIRPDAAIGDVPPTIAITSPSPGDSFLAGEILPIRFTAADDEELRSFDVLVSTGGGRRFTAVALGLPGSIREYDWRLPKDVAFDDVQLLVVAHDRRFQNSSAIATFDIASATACQTNVGYGKPGGPLLALCGAPLGLGSTAQLSLIGGPASQPGALLLSTALSPTPFLGGVLATLPIVTMVPVTTNPGGQFSIPSIPGGNGPLTLYLQAVLAAPTDPFGVTLSNALRVEFLP